MRLAYRTGAVKVINWPDVDEQLLGAIVLWVDAIPIDDRTAFLKTTLRALLSLLDEPVAEGADNAE